MRKTFGLSSSQWREDINKIKIDLWVKPWFELMGKLFFSHKKPILVIMAFIRQTVHHLI